MKETEKLNLIEVGKRVKEVREAKKLSQAALAEKLFLSQNAIAKIEKGKTAKINLEHIHKIAEQCGCSEDYLLLRTEYRTRKESVQALIGKMQNTDAMWTAFIDYVALLSGYSMKVCENGHEQADGSLSIDPQAPYLIFENGSGSHDFTMRDINIYMEDITRYAELRLQMMIERKKGV